MIEDFCIETWPSITYSFINHQTISNFPWENQTIKRGGSPVFHTEHSPIRRPILHRRSEAVRFAVLVRFKLWSVTLSILVSLMEPSFFNTSVPLLRTQLNLNLWSPKRETAWVVCSLAATVSTTGSQHEQLPPVICQSEDANIVIWLFVAWPPLWSSGQSFWL
jgi:hypothetical protein